MDITLDDQDARAEFKRLGAVAGAEEPNRLSLQFLFERISLGFESQRDPWGNAWVPLRDSTLALRRAHGISSSAALVATGAMRDSLRIEGDQIVIDDPASFHQEGTEGGSLFGGHGVPQRRIFPIIGEQVQLPSDWEASIIAIFDRFIEAP